MDHLLVCDIHIDRERRVNQKSLHNLFSNKLINISWKQERVEEDPPNEKEEKGRSLHEPIYHTSQVYHEVLSEFLLLEILGKSILRKRESIRVNEKIFRVNGIKIFSFSESTDGIIVGIDRYTPFIEGLFDIILEKREGLSRLDFSLQIEDIEFFLSVYFLLSDFELLFFLFYNSLLFFLFLTDAIA